MPTRFEDTVHRSFDTPIAIDIDHRDKRLCKEAKTLSRTTKPIVALTNLQNMAMISLLFRSHHRNRYANLPACFTKIEILSCLEIFDQSTKELFTRKEQFGRRQLLTCLIIEQMQPICRTPDCIHLCHLRQKLQSCSDHCLC